MLTKKATVGEWQTKRNEYLIFLKFRDEYYTSLLNLSITSIDFIPSASALKFVIIR